MTDTKPIQFTDDEEAEMGRALAETLHLKRDKVYPDRWVTDFGNKTDMGLFRMLRNMFLNMESGEKKPFGPF